MAAKWRWNTSRQALRSHTDGEVADRIWARLEEELPVGVAVKSQRTWAPLVFAAATFMGGVWVGATVTARNAENASSALLHAEPVAALAPAAHATMASDPVAAAPSKQQAGDQPRRVKRVAVTEPLLPDTLELGEAPEELVLVERAVPMPEVPAGPPVWQSLAEQGDYAGSLGEIRAHGGFETVLPSANGEQLMLLVDVARATGQRQLAIVALRRVVDDHKSDPLAPLAAWSLGVMLEKEGDRAGAAGAYRVYRALSPQGDFAEDALARQVRIAIALGDQEQASTLARQYVADYPTAPRSEELRKWLKQQAPGATEDTSRALDTVSPSGAADEGAADEGAADEGDADEATDEETPTEEPWDPAPRGE